MERFVKEYASYIIKNAKTYKDNEKAKKADKIVRMRNRELISTSEAMAYLAKLDFVNKYETDDDSIVSVTGNDEQFELEWEDLKSWY